jgi:hypothetical protein
MLLEKSRQQIKSAETELASSVEEPGGDDEYDD